MVESSCFSEIKAIVLVASLSVRDALSRSELIIDISFCLVSESDILPRNWNEMKKIDQDNGRVATQEKKIDHEPIN